MNSKSVIFSNARIKALENKLLTELQFGRLADSETAEDALKILSEYGYGSGAAADFDDALAAAERDAAELLRETAVEGSGLFVFLTPLDYMNAKAIAKADIAGEDDYKRLLGPEGNISHAVLKEEMAGGKYSGLPKPMAEALTKIDGDRLNGKLTPRKIDAYLDRAAYCDVFGTLKRGRDEALLLYFKADADLKNIFSYFRAAAAKMSFSQFEESFIEGGTLGLKLFADNFDKPAGILEALRYSPYKKAATLFSEGSLAAAEAAADDYLLGVLKKHRNDMFSTAPVAGFYVAKMNEIKLIKMVYALIKNKAGKEAVRQRMRELYN
jgi:V/A-type H+-transporting ATPase subunit C